MHNNNNVDFCLICQFNMAYRRKKRSKLAYTEIYKNKLAVYKIISAYSIFTMRKKQKKINIITYSIFVSDMTIGKILLVNEKYRLST